MASPNRQKKAERFNLRQDYFNALKQTAKVVDAYVKNFINNHFQLFPDLKTILIKKYGEGKTQLGSAQVRFAYEIVGGQDWKKIVPACAALTLKETCYYCLDDLFDLDLKPKNLPLSGIPFLSLSYAMIPELDNLFSVKQLKGVLQELYMLDELNGQGLLIEQKMNKIDEDQYLKKVYGYNFWEQALRIGGILGNGSQEEIKKLGEIGKNIGMAYIIANDTWDFAEDLEDFHAGKYTLPVIWAIQKIEGQDKVTLESLIGQKDISEEEKDEIRRIMVKNGIIEYGKNTANKFCQIALNLLSDFPDSKAKKMLEFSTTMTQKNRYYDFLNKYR